MAIFKCKMCGGDIHAEVGAAFGTCDSCGTTSTLPKANEERIVNLFNRANHFRRLNEFDKALAAYENILNEDATNAEAHWCVVLCRYGIEYVQDPKTHERVPTCHRTQFSSILTDADYLAALEHAPDSYTKILYEAEAKKINELQKGILAISNKEEPYDVFICYKETTDGGSRTKDSTIAQDIFYHLTKEGYRVFFAKITLEDKLGQEYEPYIFSALNSAKVMLVIGTKKEYFEAAWVKNEWSRFLALAKNDRSKLLIPCYRDMDAYDIPEELSHLQSQDMSKIGFMQDLLRGIRKVLDASKTEQKSSVPSVAVAGVAAPGVESLFKRGQQFLEDKAWELAHEYFNRVLDIDPEYAPAHIGNLCAELKLQKEEDLPLAKKVIRTQKTLPFVHLDVFNKAKSGDKIGAIQLYVKKTGVSLQNATAKIEAYMSMSDAPAGNTVVDEKVITAPLSEYRDFQKALRFADADYRAKLEWYKSEMERLEVERKEKEKRLEEERREKEEKLRKQEIYKNAVSLMRGANNIDDVSKKRASFNSAKQAFDSILEHNNSKELARQCEERVLNLAEPCLLALMEKAKRNRIAWMFVLLISAFPLSVFVFLAVQDFEMSFVEYAALIFGIICVVRGFLGILFPFGKRKKKLYLLMQKILLHWVC